MVLYFCLIPNRGARIGHQADDYFKCVSYCDKNNFIFVYHPFTCNSSTFENVLKFHLLHKHKYLDVCNIVDKIINTEYLANNRNNMSIHEFLLHIHSLPNKIMLFDDICDNYDFYKNFNIDYTDVIEIKKKYNNVLLGYYPKIIDKQYICIHVRCGDIINNENRYLGVEYFIEQFRFLITKFPELIQCLVYVVTEENFNQEELFRTNINNCIIVKTDEITSFYYLVNSSYLIASRSGFSNLAYILGNMLVVKHPLDWNAYWDRLIE